MSSKIATGKDSRQVEGGRKDQGRSRYLRRKWTSESPRKGRLEQTEEPGREEARESRIGREMARFKEWLRLSQRKGVLQSRNSDTFVSEEEELGTSTSRDMIATSPQDGRESYRKQTSEPLRRERKTQVNMGPRGPWGKGRENPEVRRLSKDLVLEREEGRAQPRGSEESSRDDSDSSFMLKIRKAGLVGRNLTSRRRGADEDLVLERDVGMEHSGDSGKSSGDVSDSTLMLNIRKTGLVSRNLTSRRRGAYVPKEYEGKKRAEYDGQTRSPGSDSEIVCTHGKRPGSVKAQSRSEVEWLMNFNSAVQREGEGVRIWADRLWDMAYMAFPRAGREELEDQVVIRFCVGLRNQEAAKHVKYQTPTTMEIALQHYEIFMYADRGEREDNKKPINVRRVERTEPGNSNIFLWEKILEKLEAMQKMRWAPLREQTIRPRRGFQCYNCGESGHMMRDCLNMKTARRLEEEERNHIDELNEVGPIQPVGRRSEMTHRLGNL